MPDPDLHSRGLGLPLGLVLLLDAQLVLRGVVWHKTYDPTSSGGWAWKKPLPPGAQQYIVNVIGTDPTPLLVGPIPNLTWFWTAQTLPGPVRT